MISDKSSPVRIVTIGDESVGKTSLTSRLVDKTFNQFEPSTVGANYQTYTTKIGDSGEYFEMQIWDTAGQEKFKSLSPIYFRNASAAVVVFSLVNRNSFDKLNDWIASFIEVAGTEAIIYIAANKADLEDEKQVSSEEAREWAEGLGYKYFETSAKTGTNVETMFNSLASDLKNKQTILNQKPKNSLKKQESSGCC